MSRLSLFSWFKLPPLKGYQISVPLSLSFALLLPLGRMSGREDLFFSLGCAIFHYVQSWSLSKPLLSWGCLRHLYVVFLFLIIAGSLVFSHPEQMFFIVTPVLFAWFLYGAMRVGGTHGQNLNRDDFFEIGGLAQKKQEDFIAATVFKVYAFSFVVKGILVLVFPKDWSQLLPYLASFLHIFPGVNFVLNIAEFRSDKNSTRRSKAWEA